MAKIVFLCNEKFCTEPFQVLRKLNLCYLPFLSQWLFPGNALVGVLLKMFFCKGLIFSGFVCLLVSLG